MHAAAINPIDWIVMEGHMKEMLDYDLPWIVGYDVAGVVSELGAAASKFSVGDRVFGRADGMQAGTMAEYCAVTESDLAVQAGGATHQQSAGIPLAGLTAWQALRDHGGLEADQRVLAEAKGVTFEQFFMSPNGDQLAELASLIDDGTVTPIVDREFPLDDVESAYAHARSGEANGKVVVTMR